MTDRLTAALAELVEALREELRTEAHADPRTPDRLYAIPETAERLAVGRTMVYDLIGRGELRVIRVGRRVLVPAGEISRYIESRRDDAA